MKALGQALAIAWARVAQIPALTLRKSACGWDRMFSVTHFLLIIKDEEV